MSNVNGRVCDWCTKMIYGKEKAAWKAEDHIQLEGRLSFNRWSKEKNAYAWEIMADESEPVGGFRHFCTVKCFVEYMAAQYDLAKARADRRIMAVLRSTDAPGDHPLYDKDIVGEYASRK